ncbi:unnamed protein product, partial [Allacma fusca]
MQKRDHDGGGAGIGGGAEFLVGADREDIEKSP